MRKTKVTRMILETRRILIVRKSADSSHAAPSIPEDVLDADGDEKGAMKPQKENRTNE